MKDKVEEALELALDYHGIEGGHHKSWIIDQMVRILAGDRYESIIKEWCIEDGDPNAYEWDEGIAP